MTGNEAFENKLKPKKEDMQWRILLCFQKHSGNPSFRRTKHCKRCPHSEECKDMERYIRATAMTTPKVVPSTHTANIMKGKGENND